MEERCKVAGFKPTKSNIFPWVFFIFKLYKWYQIAEKI